jgi:hypothetical protein
MDEKKLYRVLYRFTTKDRQLCLIGILHSNGYMIASNAYILAKVHYEAYNFDYEDLIIDENGNEVKDKYLKIDHIFGDPSDLKELDSQLVQDIRTACDKLPKGTNEAGKYVSLDLGNFAVHTYQLSCCFELFDVLGETPRAYLGKLSRPIELISDNCHALCMPHVNISIGANDLLFTVEEALAFNPKSK